MMEWEPEARPPELMALLAAAESGRIEPVALESAMGFLGGPEEVLTLLLEPDPPDFDVSLIPDDSISRKRADALENGARPTTAEIALWREARLQEARESCGDGFHMISVWRLPVAGPQLVCAFHEDQGTVIEVLGPFLDRTGLLTALRERGILELEEGDE